MPKARLHFEGDNTGIEKEARLYSLTQEVEDKLDSISSIETTLQGEIDDLQDQINQVASRGRYLTTWDCTTGLPDTNPTTDPYTYRPGDYYIVGTVGGTNYRPHGSEYHVGVASQTLETQAVSVNDLYIYDGTQWTLQRTGASVYAVWGSITGNLQAQTDLQNALDAKANKTDVLEKTNTTAFTPTADYHPATKKYTDDNDTFIGATAPTNNVVEGRLWYDTAADVLKVYNGSQWVPTGKTYTAGQNIQISASDVISATDTVYSAGENVNIVCPTESDMKGPCPSGFHVPLSSEWGALCGILTNTFSMASNATTMGTYLKMPMTGLRDYRNAGAGSAGFIGNYWSSAPSGTYNANRLNFSSGDLYPQGASRRAYGFTIRCFKDTPTVPTSSWTILYDGSSVAIGAGVFYNATDGLISVSGDGVTWYTIQDKNLGAITVFNQGDTVTDANCGYYYQRGNNYGFTHSGNVTTSSTQVNASNYGPGDYYSSSTFIIGNNDWSNVQNDNLWGGETQGTWQDCEHPIISATDTTYSASDFDIKDLTDSTGLRTTWNSKQDALTAGSHINISSNVVSTTGLQDELTTGENIIITQEYSSDMRGPCPKGFHIPTNNEWVVLQRMLISTLSLPKKGDTAKTYLKMPFPGRRDFWNGNVSYVDNYGYYWSSSRANENDAYILDIYPANFDSQYRVSRTFGGSVRAIKDTPVVPDNTWATLYDGSSVASGAGVFWNQVDSLISVSGDGTTWVTIADKNLGATTVYNDGDILSESNCGGFFQRGNNYMFPFSGNVTNSSVQVDASNYGPGNYYNSSTFINVSGRWDTTDNANLRGGVSQGQRLSATVISAIVPEAPNVKQFILSGTSGATALAEAQDIFDWYLAGNNPLLVYNNYTYILSSVANDKLGFKGAITQQNQNSSSFAGQDVIYLNFNGNNEVTSITTDTAVIAGSYLRLGQNYTTPYIPTNDGDPTSKKYVDEHGPNIPVYYYLGDFNNDITFNIIEAGVYRIYVRAYHGTTVDKTLTLTVDGVTVGTLTSNLIEHLNASINFTASAGSTAVLSVSSKTNFTIQEVYIEKVNIQSGYLTATVN